MPRKAFPIHPPDSILQLEKCNAFPSYICCSLKLAAKYLTDWFKSICAQTFYYSWNPLLYAFLIFAHFFTAAFSIPSMTFVSGLFILLPSHLVTPSFIFLLFYLACCSFYLDHCFFSSSYRSFHQCYFSQKCEYICTHILYIEVPPSFMDKVTRF